MVDWDPLDEWGRYDARCRAVGWRHLVTSPALLRLTVLLLVVLVAVVVALYFLNDDLPERTLLDARHWRLLRFSGS